MYKKINKAIKMLAYISNSNYIYVILNYKKSDYMNAFYLVDKPFMLEPIVVIDIEKTKLTFETKKDFKKIYKLIKKKYNEKKDTNLR